MNRQADCHRNAWLRACRESIRIETVARTRSHGRSSRGCQNGALKRLVEALFSQTVAITLLSCSVVGVLILKSGA